MNALMVRTVGLSMAKEKPRLEPPDSSQRGISSYNNPPQAWLAVRGISRDRFEHHPLPESSSVDDYPYPYYDNFSTVLEPQYSGSDPAYSAGGGGGGRGGGGHYSPRSLHSSESTEATQSWLSASNGWTSTGNTTERSSLYSEDVSTELDRAASRRVRRLFEEIDSMLFEDQSGSQHLQAECRDWVSHFPHLRILGRQLLPPQDPGYQHVLPVTTTSLVPDAAVTDDTDINIAIHDLSVTGRPAVAGAGYGQPAADYEEVFAQDGQVEDIIALDRTMEDDLRSSGRGGGVTGSRARGRHHMPPVTPQACVKDNIGGATFDCIWAETISWIRGLLDSYSQHFVPELSDLDAVPELPGGLPAAASARDGARSSREAALLARGHGGGAGAAGGAGIMRLYPTAAHQLDGGLDGLLTISTKALNTRERSTLGESLDGGLGRPGSSFTNLKLGGAGGGGVLALGVVGRPASKTGESSRLMSAGRGQRMAPAGRLGRLAPLPNPETRVKTPNADHESERQLQNVVLHGHRLSTSPPPPLAAYTRNGALPPIQALPPPPGGVDTPEPKKKTQFVAGSVRASSAVHEKEARTTLKERGGDKYNALAQETRPSTTHALYRSETPGGFGGLGVSRRSSTPMGALNLRSNPLGGVGSSPGGGGGGVSSAAVQMSITGSSINPALGGGEHHSILEANDGGDTFHDAAELGGATTQHAQQWGTPGNLHPHIRRARQPLIR